MPRGGVGFSLPRRHSCRRLEFVHFGPARGARLSVPLRASARSPGRDRLSRRSATNPAFTGLFSM